MKCTAYSRAERSSPADGVSSCKQSPRFSLSSAAPLKNTPFRVCFFNAFLTHLRDLFLNRAWSLSSALDDFSCKQSLIFACRQQLIKYRLFTTKTSCFLMCAKFFAQICAIYFKNRTWSLSSALGDREYFVLSSPSLASSSSMVYFVIGACRRRYCLFWFFQLEDIVDFPLIHRPYGFIVQFLMINTGNGGSFVQL